MIKKTKMTKKVVAKKPMRKMQDGGKTGAQLKKEGQEMKAKGLEMKAKGQQMKKSGEISKMIGKARKEEGRIMAVEGRKSAFVKYMDPIMGMKKGEVVAPSPYKKGGKVITRKKK